MTEAVSGIVKSSRVRLAEPREISGSIPGQRTGPRAATARIIEQKATGIVVVEVTCTCGSVIHLHCDCAGAADDGKNSA